MKLSDEARSRILSAVHSDGNASTELKFASMLRAAKISGWRRRQELYGRPDFVFRSERVAVFIDGCFWHGCPRCSLVPRVNTAYWIPKLARNQQRDKEVSARLRKEGWIVLRVWEHQLTNPARILAKVRSALNRSKMPAGKQEKGHRASIQHLSW